MIFMLHTSLCVLTITTGYDLKNASRLTQTFLINTDKTKFLNCYLQKQYQQQNNDKMTIFFRIRMPLISTHEHLTISCFFIQMMELKYTLKKL